MANACLGSQMYHALWHGPGEYFGETLFVRDVLVEKAKTRMRQQTVKAILLESLIIVIIEIIDAYHFMSRSKQPERRMQADKTGNSRNQQFHFRRLSMFLLLL
jgi:hypothetical protein